MSLRKSQECGQSATHDGIFIVSPAMVIASLEFKNTLLRIPYQMKGYEMPITIAQATHCDATHLR